MTLEQQILDRNRLFIEQTILTDEEVRDAIYEAKKKKYFHIKNKDKWTVTVRVENDQRIEKPENVPAADESDAKQNQ